MLRGLFFIAVGMSIDLNLIAAQPWAIVLGAIALLAIKSMLLFGIGLRPGKLGGQDPLQLGMVLALGGR